jgi:hypothetical protein
VLFYVDAQTSQVRRVTVLDAQHNQNVFTFANVVITNAATNTANPTTTGHP